MFDDSIQDVWDGSVLKKLRAPNRFFSNQQNLALSLFTDGVPLYKSSKLSMWPVFLVILNLPASIRSNAENIILCGLWVGPKKPLMSLLIDPVVESLHSLATSGLTINMQSGTCILSEQNWCLGYSICLQRLLYSMLNSLMECIDALFVCTRENGFRIMPEFISLMLSIPRENACEC